MNEKKIATSINFNPKNDQAPSITATGSGEDAEFIIAVAEEYDIPVYKDPHLAKTLGQLEVGDMVPPELYEAVAEVLSFVYSLDQNQGKAEEILKGG